MTDLIPTRLAELKKIAEAATQERWKERTHVFVKTMPDDLIWTGRINDAAHVAAFDPPTVLALLDRVCALEMENAMLKGERETANACVQSAHDLVEKYKARADWADRKAAAAHESHEGQLRNTIAFMTERDAALVRAERAEAEAAGLRKALEPFAKVAVYDRGNSPVLTDADFDAAREALTRKALTNDLH